MKGLIGYNIVRTGHPFDFSWMHAGPGGAAGFLLFLVVLLVIIGVVGGASSGKKK